MGVYLLRWAAGIIAVYHLCVVSQLPTWFGVFVPDQVHKAVSLCSALFVLFLFMPPDRHRQEAISSRFRHSLDFCFLLLALAGGGFVIFFHDRILGYTLFGFLDRPGIIASSLLVISLLVAIRRVTGWVLPAIILFFICVTMFQQFLPGVLRGIGFPIEQLLFSVYVGDAGIFGRPLDVAANIVIVYLIFGALMHRCGASHWFMDMALALTGWSRGGPAKAAVLASAMFGSISGSPSGNSATTGVFTIPLMKRIGYTGAFAAAVEAVASSGGMILPPVMGAIAFLMAEWINVPYVEIVFAAAIPAVLYFFIVFFSVHLQAKKDGVAPLSASELPSFKAVFIRGWYYLVPMLGLFYFLIVAALPPGIAGVYACLFVLGASFLSKDRSNWLLPRLFLQALEEGVTRWVVIAVITGGVGMMIGAIELSGVGLKFSRFIIDLAGGHLVLAMLFVGVVSLFVGMGLDATPAYITLATLMAPALIRMGISDIAAHLFVIYWGLASFFTPPTCIAVFVTSGIAGSRVWETGGEAVRLGIAAFVIPFAFVFNPGLLLQGELIDMVFAIITAVFGAAFFAMGIRGYAFLALNRIQRLIIFAAACLAIAPGLLIPLAGLVLGGAILLPQWVIGRTRTA